jgi:hypothetical protein
MGQRCGYKIWYQRPKYLEAERHAIWEETENIETLRLMRRERTGFVLPDSVEKKSGMKLNNHRFRVGKDVLTRRLI